MARVARVAQLAACCLQQGGRRYDKYAGGTRHANSQWGAATATATTRIAFDLPTTAEAATTPATAVGLDSLEMEKAKKKNQVEIRVKSVVELMMPLRKDDLLYR